MFSPLLSFIALKGPIGISLFIVLVSNKVQLVPFFLFIFVKEVSCFSLTSYEATLFNFLTALLNRGLWLLFQCNKP